MHDDGSTRAVIVPNTTNALGGGVFYFGIIDTADPFIEVFFRNTGSYDPFGLDDVTVADFAPILVSRDGCKKGGWKLLTRANGTHFKDQGACILYVNTAR